MKTEAPAHTGATITETSPKVQPGLYTTRGVSPSLAEIIGDIRAGRWIPAPGTVGYELLKEAQDAETPRRSRRMVADFARIMFAKESMFWVEVLESTAAEVDRDSLTWVVASWSDYLETAA